MTVVIRNYRELTHANSRYLYTTPLTPANSLFPEIKQACDCLKLSIT